MGIGFQIDKSGTVSILGGPAEESGEDGLNPAISFNH
jgi:hypothetical protein